MKKTLNVFKVVFTWVFVAFTIGVMVFTMISVTTFNQNDRSFLGIKMFIVRTDSMKKTDFDAGDLIFVKEVKDPSTLKEGDIITFISRNSDSFGKTLTHKIRRVTTTTQGELAFVTYGTTTDTDDEALVTPMFLVGQYKGHVDNVGSFFAFIKTTPGYLCCIFLPAMLLIGIQTWNVVRLLRQRKEEQMAQIREEKEELAQERKKTEEMLQELQALRAQLEQQAQKDPPET